MGCSGGKKLEMKVGKDSRCPESGRETEARKTKIAMGNCIKSDLERVEEERKNYK